MLLRRFFSGFGPVYSSTGTWKFDPQKRKLDTPARRAWSEPRTHDRVPVRP
jgi:hypothetical protein